MTTKGGGARTLKIVGATLAIILALGSILAFTTDLIISPVKVSQAALAADLGAHEADADRHPSREWIELQFNYVNQALDRIEKKLDK